MFATTSTPAAYWRYSIANSNGFGAGGSVSGTFREAAEASKIQEVEHLRSVFPETWLWDSHVTR